MPQTHCYIVATTLIKPTPTRNRTSKTHLASVAAAIVASIALFGVLSPAAASYQNNPAVLTSHLPWLAPIGHRQPTRADVPQNEVLSASDRRQQHLDVELDRKLTICHGC
jgi:hypothetical protein